MSRIGKIPVAIPAGTTVTIDKGVITVKGPKGSLSTVLHPAITVEVTDTAAVIKRATDSNKDRALHGLVRAQIRNMVTGVSTGFDRKLEMNGVGFRAQVQGVKLNLQVGFSHPVVMLAPEGIKFTVEENIITVSGIDRTLVGEIASRIRGVHKPEPYKGKGIRYTDEHVARKEGKRVAASQG